MTAPELKPCPFCGGEASISKDHDPDGNGAFYAVKCRKCRAKSPEIYAVETCNIHFAQVRDAWNRRADLAAVQPAQGDYFEGLEEGIKIGRGEPQPDPRDEVIARLVGAVEHLLRNYLQDELYEPDLCVNDDHWTAIHDVDAALAAAKAVQHD